MDVSIESGSCVVADCCFCSDAVSVATDPDSQFVVGECQLSNFVVPLLNAGVSS